MQILWTIFMIMEDKASAVVVTAYKVSSRIINGA